MNKAAVFLVVAGALSMLAGCQEAVQSVDWYKAHKAERDDVLAKCRANAGTIGATPNCVNAGQAQSAVTWGAKSGIKTPAPLTADDIKNK